MAVMVCVIGYVGERVGGDVCVDASYVLVLVLVEFCLPSLDRSSLMNGAGVEDKTERFGYLDCEVEEEYSVRECRVIANGLLYL
jgi:hypothetical protein